MQEMHRYLVPRDQQAQHGAYCGELVLGGTFCAGGSSIGNHGDSAGDRL